MSVEPILLPLGAADYVGAVTVDLVAGANNWGTMEKELTQSKLEPGPALAKSDLSRKPNPSVEYNTVNLCRLVSNALCGSSSLDNYGEPNTVAYLNCLKYPNTEY